MGRRKGGRGNWSLCKIKGKKADNTGQVWVCNSEINDRHAMHEDMGSITVTKTTKKMKKLIKL